MRELTQQDEEIAYLGWVPAAAGGVAGGFWPPVAGGVAAGVEAGGFAPAAAARVRLFFSISAMTKLAFFWASSSWAGFNSPKAFSRAEMAGG